MVDRFFGQASDGSVSALKSMIISGRFQEIFGHPNQDGREGALIPIEFALQGTDYKAIGAYRKFSGDHAEFRVMPRRSL